MPVTQTEKETPAGVSFFVVFQIDRYTERWVSLSNPRIVELHTQNYKLNKVQFVLRFLRSLSKHSLNVSSFEKKSYLCSP